MAPVAAVVAVQEAEHGEIARRELIDEGEVPVTAATAVTAIAAEAGVMAGVVEDGDR